MMNTQTFYFLPSISNSNGNAHQQLSNTRFLRNDKIKYSFLWLILILLTLWGLTGTLHAQNSPSGGKGASGGLDSLLLLAVQANDLEKVKTLVTQGANVNAKDTQEYYEGYTPLHYAKSIEVAQFLIDKGADIQAKKKDGNTPLHYVSNLEIAQLLIDKGADIQAKNNNGDTPLHNALVYSHFDIAKFLIEKGADVNARDKDGNSPLYEASSYSNGGNQDKNIDLIKLLIEKGADVKAKNNTGNIPLHIALDRKNSNTIPLLIEKGADIQVKDNNGNTPLQLALVHYLPEIAQLLIEKGADIQVKDKDGNTLLHSSIRKNFTQIAQLLLEKGSDIQTKDNEDNTPLHLALEYNRSPEIAKILIEKGADIQAKDKQGNTPLHFVKDVVIAKILIDKGADIQAKDNEGNTPLHNTLLSYQSNPELAKILIDKGVDIQAKNNQENTPLHLALENKIPQTAKLLIEKGADIQAKNNNGDMPLHLALKNNLTEIAKFLIEKEVDMQTGGKDGCSPLHLVKNIKLCQLLIEKGADIHAKDNNGNTPLHSAVMQNQFTIVQFLIQKGAKTTFENSSGKTPIQLAKDNKNEEIYAFLQGEKSYQTYLKTAPLWNAIKFRDIPKTKKAIQTGADSTYRNYEEKNALDLLRDYSYHNWKDFIDNRPYNYVKPTVQIGHTSGVTQITLIPKHKAFLGINWNAIILWDLATGKQIRTYTNHTGKVTQIIVLPDGESFLSASEDNTIKHWDLASGMEIHTFVGHTGDVSLMKLLPNNKTFLSASKDNTIKLWDLFTGKEIKNFEGHRSSVTQIHLLLDANTFLTHCGGDNNKDFTIKLWDLTSGKEIKSFEGHTASISQILLLPDYKTFLSASEDNTIKLWGLESGKEIKSFIGHKGSVTQIHLLSDANTFLTHCGGYKNKDFTIKLWDLMSGKEIKSFEGHTASISQILLLPDNKTFLTGSNDKTLKHWDLASGKEIRAFQGHTDGIGQIQLLPDNKTFLSNTNNSFKSIYHWDLLSGKVIQTFDGLNNNNIGVTWYPTSKIFLLPDNKSFLLMASWSKNIKQWDISSGKEIQTFMGENTGMINEVKLLPNQQVFLTVSETDKRVKYWNLFTCQQTQSFEITYEHRGYNDKFLIPLPDNQTFLTNEKFIDGGVVIHRSLVTGDEIRRFLIYTFDILGSEYEEVVYSGYIFSTFLAPDGKSFLTADRKGVIKHWDIATGKEISSFQGHISIQFSSDSKTFLISDKGSIRHWDLATGKEIRTFQGATSPIVTLPDNKSFLTASDDNTVKHWDIATGKEIRTFAGHADRIDEILLLSDNKSFLTASYDKTVKYWDISTGKEIHTFQANVGYRDKIILLPDNKSFLVTSEDNTVKHWDLVSGKELGTFHSRYGSIESIHFLPDSTRFITVNEQNSLTLWDMKTYQEIATLIPVAGDNQDYVVISPDGRFDGTPAGMDKLVHFVVGNEIIELSQLKERFYTPDLWKTLMEAPEKLSSDESLNQIELYPEFDLEGKGNQLNIKLRPRNGGIGKVNVYINGREVNESKTASPNFNPNSKTQIQINLKNYQSYFKEGKNTISVKAYHAEGWLASRFQHITYQKGSLQSRDTTSKATPEGLQEGQSADLDFDANITESKAVGDFYALCIGTSDYTGEGIKDLTFPTSDAQSMAEALKIGAKKFFIDEDEPNKNKLFIRTLTTDDKNPLNQPSKDNIRRVFGEIASKAKAEDMFVVFFAGHGTTFKKEGERNELFYYLTKDAGSRSVMQDALRKSHTISSDELIAWLKEIKANKQVMILDACHSGQAVDNISAQRDIPPSQKLALELMKDRTGLYIISGSAADAVSYESSEYGQGFLTYSLLLGMTGAALDKENSHLNVGTWFKYASNEVNRMASEYNSTQQPQVAEPKNNFWIGKFEEKDRNLIPLKEAKPMFGVPNFMNWEMMKDNLSLTKLVKEELTEEISSKALQGRSASYIFTDSDHQKVNLINGLYKVDNQGNVKVSFKIYKGNDFVAEIKDMEGNTKEIKDLAEMIVSEAKKRVVK